MRPGDRRRRVAKGVAVDGVDSAEFAHPVKLVETTEEVSSFVALALLAVVLIGLSVFFLEVILAVAIATIVAVVRVLFGRWQCEVVAPDGRLKRIRADSLREARTRCAQIESSVASGLGQDEMVG